MDKNQITCIQNVRFIFNFFELSKGKSILKNIDDNTNMTAESLRNLGHSLQQRFSRIASMVEILQSSHDNWEIARKKDRIIMETESFDFNDAIKILSAKGFKDDEYILKVEYERKWGML
ncbi:hypothetical protein AB8U03_02120 [Clostridium sp. Mt-5]|uniref:Phage protein n=1 Tax=Clostridium moutaii TaxID=3240932 RepID=A0ABV4BKE0_9CLOT